MPSGQKGIKEAEAGQVSRSTAAADSLQLTDVAVLPRPTRDALAEVSTNQVAAGVGIDTRLAVAFIGI